MTDLPNYQQINSSYACYLLHGDWYAMNDTGAAYKVCRMCAEGSPGDALEAIAERSKPTDPTRWPNADPAWIPALEAKLADQLKYGGYDCVAQRSLMVRAMRLAKNEAVRAKAFENRDTGHVRLEALDVGLATARLPKPLIAYKRSR